MASTDKLPASANSYKRAVNIELLRIYCMFMVLIVHYNVPINGQPDYNMLMTAPWKALGVTGLKSLSFICVNCFILISGYFGIKWKLKSFIKYIFQIAYWSVLTYILCYCCHLHDFSGIEIIKRLLLCLTHNWFFISYLGLYIIAPVLNSYIETISVKKLGQFLLAFYAFAVLFGYFTQYAPDFNKGMSFISFAGLYMTGAYLKRTDLRIFRQSAKFDFLVYIVLGLVMTAVSILTRYIGLTKDIYGYMNPVVRIQGIYLFLFFSKININHGQKAILFFSSSAFSVLLLHGFKDSAKLYDNILHNIAFNFPLPFLVSICFMMLCFVFAVLLDKTRIMAFDSLYNKFISK